MLGEDIVGIVALRFACILRIGRIRNRPYDLMLAAWSLLLVLSQWLVLSR